MLRRIYFIITFFLTVYVSSASGQCPINIGFDNGDFTNWEASIGNYPGFGVTNLNTKGIVPGLHTIISRKSQQVDSYGGFPLVSPNGSNYVAKLGDGITGRVDAAGSSVSNGGAGKAEQLTFTFKVPANNNNFSLIYYYAVVIEDPPNDASHNENTKPKFTAAVFDVDANKYADCGNFNFVAISSLPGFALAPNQQGKKDVYYKNWSPVTIDLRGYAGKTLRLEFTANNCTPSGHFAYAYIDLNQNCNSPVSGNMKCPNDDGITLSAPAGFKEYYWYNEKDFSTVIGTNNTLTPTPTPPVGTGYSVRIVPYPGIGCPDTIYTTILKTENAIFNVTPLLKVCRTEAADITATNITAGTDPTFISNGLVYYDKSMTNIVSDPTNITVPGPYYIQATANSGCVYLRRIDVTFLETPTLKITPPKGICHPSTVDITLPAVTKNSLIGNNLTYWRDPAATKPLIHPEKIDTTNTYYIKATNAANGCFDIQPVLVLIDNQPLLVTHTINGCNTADMTTPAVTAGSSNFIPPFSYFLDSAATKPVANPKAVPLSGKYYIQAFNINLCPAIASVQVNVSPYPQLIINKPVAVTFPQPVDITRTFPHEANVNYAYYRDSLGINLLKDPTAVIRDGTYYIQGTNQITGCSKTAPIKVTVLPPVDVNFSVNTFTPNGDGNNDVFTIKTPVSVIVYHFSVYNSYGRLLYETTQANRGWDGTGASGKRLPVGTYYWIFEGYDNYTNQKLKKAGSISLIL